MIKVALCVVVAAGLAALPFIPQPAEVQAAPITAASLLGTTLDQVIDRLGIPDDTSASSGHLELHYGSVQVIAQADCVVMVEGEIPADWKATTRPRTGYYVGQPTAEFAKRQRENPVSRLAGSSGGVQLIYADGSKVHLVHGRVGGIKAAPK